MPIFRSKHAEDADKIAVRLAAARTTLGVAERELTDQLPDLILTDDHSTLALLRSRVADAGDRVALVELAHRSALHRENQRLADARFRARKSELSAFSQHLGAVTRAAKNCQRVVAEYQASWRELIDAAERARRLLPADGYRVFPELFDGRLQSAVARELARVGRRGEFMGLGAGPSLPGSDEGVFPAGTAPSSVLPLVEHIQQIAAFYSDRFRDHLALPAGRTEAADQKPEEPPEPEAPVEPIDPAKAAREVVALGAPVSVVAGAEPVPVSPHPEGSTEAIAYETALAEMQGRTKRAPAEPAEPAEAING